MKAALAIILVGASLVGASLVGDAYTREPKSAARGRVLESIAAVVPEHATTRRTRPASSDHYCDRWPNRCNVSGSCVAAGGCQPMIWACCSPGLGCWAVLVADACPDTADLYPFDCEAGESAFDPASGESIIICHD